MLRRLLLSSVSMANYEDAFEIESRSLKCWIADDCYSSGRDAQWPPGRPVLLLIGHAVATGHLSRTEFTLTEENTAVTAVLTIALVGAALANTPAIRQTPIAPEYGYFESLLITTA